MKYEPIVILVLCHYLLELSSQNDVIGLVLSALEQLGETECYYSPT